MKYYKSSDGRYIYAISTSRIGSEISEAEYTAIKAVIADAPTLEKGYGCLLSTDLTWELYELPPEPPEPDDEATAEDYEAALARLGVAT